MEFPPPPPTDRLSDTYALARHVNRHASNHSNRPNQPIPLENELTTNGITGNP